LVIALMIGMFLIHELTALWDINYAITARRVSPVEQMMHSFLEIVPLMAIAGVIALHWGQFLALFGMGGDIADFSLGWKTVPLPYWYLSMVMGAVVLLAFVPYAEEFCRCLHARTEPQGLDPAMPLNETKLRLGLRNDGA